jgi:hypothetical protein
MIEGFGTDYLDDLYDELNAAKERIEKLEAALRRIIDRAEYRMGHHVTDGVCAIARDALDDAP